MQSQQSREETVLAHLFLVRKVVLKFIHSAPIAMADAFDDMMSEGTIGLIKAVDSFDPRQGVQFTTYAYRSIQSEICHYLRANTNSLHIPENVRLMARRISGHQQQMMADQGRKVSFDEAAHQLGLCPPKILACFYSADCEEKMEDQIDIKGSSACFDIDNADFAVANLKKLKPKERHVLLLFYFRGWNKSQIARKMGISVNYVCYLLKKGIATLRANQLCARDKLALQTLKNNGGTMDAIDFWSEFGARYDHLMHFNFIRHCGDSHQTLELVPASDTPPLKREVSCLSPA